MEPINWLSWLQHTDYDVWLILMEYLEPIIHLRKSFPRIRRDPWFNEFISNNRCTKLYFTLDKAEEYQPLSVYYNRYLNYKDRIIDIDHCYNWQDLFGRKNTRPNLHGITYYSQEHKCHITGRHHYACNISFQTKEQIFNAIKETSDIKVAKSWTKGRMLKALMSY